MTRISVGDVSYYIEQHGNFSDAANGSRPLLLLHGFTGCTANWRSLASTILAREGGYAPRRLIAVDALGHGRSDAPENPARYAIDRAAADLSAVLDTLGIGRVDLLGYSMGGRLALAFAVLTPDRVGALVLESASPGLRTPEARKARIAADMALADSIEREGVPAFVDRWERLPLFASQRRLPAEQREALRRQRLDNRATGLANSLRGMGTGAQPSFWGRLPTLNAPTLLITGEDDPKFSAIAQAMNNLLPNLGARGSSRPPEMDAALRGHGEIAGDLGMELDRDIGWPATSQGDGNPGTPSLEDNFSRLGCDPGISWPAASGNDGNPDRGPGRLGLRTHSWMESRTVLPDRDTHLRNNRTVPGRGRRVVPTSLAAKRRTDDRQTHRWCVVAGAGHTVHLEQPQRFADLVRLLLEEGGQ